jgi:Cu/Ag efflux pump CusA
MLNIEAYPNPTPVILEITAQAPGLSAEEMERYYTRPMEIGLYSTPGIDVIRSTSFYGLSFVRVTFKYGIDYFFAFSQAAIAMQQNVNLPGGLVPTIQANSSTGEIYRYQVVGPPHYGITNLRTVQDWIVARRLLTIPGIAAVNSWGGPTKTFQVDVDPHKLEAYNLSVPQILNVLGNANINVDGREITVGQQSINIRGVGLIDDGGNDDVAQGYKVDDIQNVVLTQVNGRSSAGQGRCERAGRLPHGFLPEEAMFRAASTRMRPLLMTALSACIGLFPAAISTGIGSQVQRPLATVIVGGMLVGPFMLLIAVPALRMLFLGDNTRVVGEAQ